MGGTAWSLILFTLLIQAGVGVFLISEITVGSLARKLEQSYLPTRNLSLVYLSLVLVVGGIAVSFFHLGSPQNAYHSLNNWQSSWLSREIFFLVLLTSLLAALSFLRWKKSPNSLIQRILAVLSFSSGLVLIFSMSKLYMLPTVPSWNNLGTPVAFFITTLLLGCQIVWAILWRQKTVVRLIRFSLLLIVLQLGFALFFNGWLFSSEPVSAAGLSNPNLDLQLGFAIRIALVIVAALLLVILLLRMKKTGADRMRVQFLVYGAFCAILISEILGRYLFFAAYYRLGL